MFNNELWQKPAGGGGGGGIYTYQIANSLFFNGTSQALTKTWGTTASDNNKKALSVWIKRTGTTGTRAELGSVLNTKIVTASEFNQLEINTNNPAGASDQFHYGFNNGATSNIFLPKWRDPAAWMHIIWIWNSDESTGVDRLKFYVNGVNYVVNDTTYFNNRAGSPYPTSGMDSTFGKNGMVMQIGSYVYNNAEWYGGQMAEFIMIDGAASYTDFGELNNGVWIPKDPSGLTFGNNGFHLNFADASNPGNDVSGNNNDFANIGSIPASATLGDSPTFSATDGNGGNFMIWNALLKGSFVDLRGANTINGANGSADASYPPANTAFPTGKWYYEWRVGNDNGSYPNIGLTDLAGDEGPDTYAGGARGFFYCFLYRNDGNLVDSSGGRMVNFGTTTLNTTGVVSYTTGDIISWYIDADNGKVWFAKNGTIPNSGNPATGSNPQIAWTGRPPGLTVSSQVYPGGWGMLNAGQDGTFQGTETAQGNTDSNGYGNFYYAPPTDFLAVCSGNLPIADSIDPAQTSDNYPQELFNTLLYTGTGSSNAFTGLGFKPDWTWIKNRQGQNDHKLTDSSRGVTKIWEANTSTPEQTESGVTAFGADGFTLGSDGQFNSSSELYASWNWRMNGGTTSTNTLGNVTSTVQVDPTGNMSIITYTGTGVSGNTVGHGLSQAPDFFFIKRLNSADNNMVAARIYPTNSHDMRLDTNAAAANASLFPAGQSFDNVTATVYPMASNAPVNNNGSSYVGYFFSNVKGFIQAGRYKGNGIANGPFVYLGFRPALVITKNLDVTQDWMMFDDKREGTNPDNDALYPNQNYSETDTDVIDLLSNGFSIKTGSNPNSANLYFYMAWAENPFNYSRAR